MLKQKTNSFIPLEIKQKIAMEFRKKVRKQQHEIKIVRQLVCLKKKKKLKFCFKFKNI